MDKIVRSYAFGKPSGAPRNPDPTRSLQNESHHPHRTDDPDRLENCIERHFSTKVRIDQGRDVAYSMESTITIHKRKPRGSLGDMDLVAQFSRVLPWRA
jgi:hypothetical protein